MQVDSNLFSEVFCTSEIVLWSATRIHRTSSMECLLKYRFICLSEAWIGPINEVAKRNFVMKVIYMLIGIECIFIVIETHHDVMVTPVTAYSRRTPCPMSGSLRGEEFVFGTLIREFFQSHFAYIKNQPNKHFISSVTSTTRDCIHATRPCTVHVKTSWWTFQARFNYVIFSPWMITSHVAAALTASIRRIGERTNSVRAEM